MATLKQEIRFCLISFFIIFFNKTQAKEPNLPPNIFNNDPISSYYIWWRPQKMIFDIPKVHEIQRKINSIDIDKSESIELDNYFGENINSAFLYPVLASHGDKGIRLLIRFLEPYTKNKVPDDTWLLIIASIGRIPTPQAQFILEDELKRTIKKLKYTQTAMIGGKEISLNSFDIRKSVLDALLACIAGQKHLSAQKIDTLNAQVNDKKLSSFLWTAGLEWNKQFISESGVQEIVEDALNLCSDDELLKAMNLDVSTDRLMGIWGFLTDKKQTWSINKELLINHKVKKPLVFDYLLIQYMYILAKEAEIGNGIYSLDKEVISLIDEKEIAEHGKLDFISKILLGCKTSYNYPKWDQFLIKNASMLDSSYVPMAEAMIQRINGSNQLGQFSIYDVNEIKKELHNIKKPGVYLRGFNGNNLEVN